MNVNYAAHEMGHCYGLDHARMVVDGIDVDYGDKWDIMGDGWHYEGKVFGDNLPGLPGLIAPNGNSGPGLCGPNLVALGWMSEDRVFNFDSGPVTVTLKPLDTTHLSGYLIARITKPDCVYTIEFRHKGYDPKINKGWDRGIPHSGVVIHRERTLYHVGQKGWRQCYYCNVLAYSPDSSPSGWCTYKFAVGGLGPHIFKGFDYSLGLKVGSFPGESGWRRCNSCRGLAYSPDGSPSGFCPNKGSHVFSEPEIYTLMNSDNPMGLDKPIGQSGWKKCNNCLGLVFESSFGWCPIAPPHAVQRFHDFIGSPNYTLPNNDFKNTDPTPFFEPSFLDDDPIGWDWRPFQIFRDKHRNLAIRIDSIDVYPTSPTATVTIGIHSLEPTVLEVEREDSSLRETLLENYN